MKVDEEEIQIRIDRNLRWRDANYRLEVMLEQSRRFLADPKARPNIRFVKPESPKSPIILPSARTGLLVGPDGNPI